MNKKIISFFSIFKQVLVVTFSFFLFAFTVFAYNDLECEINETTLCSSENIVFKLLNVYGEGYDNAHAELRDYATPGYDYALCCEALTQSLIVDCDDSFGVEILRLSDETNAHVQAALDYQGLVAFWKFNNDLKDDISNVFATNSGASWTLDRRNNLNSALEFNGGSNRVSTHITDNDYFSDGFSLTAWIKPYGLGGNSYGRVMDKSSGTSANNGFYFLTTSGNSLWFRIASGSQIKSSNDAFSLNEWSFVVVTVDGAGNVNIYSNASLVGSGQSGSPSLITTANALSIGAHSTANTRGFDGVIDGVRIYNRVLSLQEIQRLHDDGLVAHWTLDKEHYDVNSDLVLDFSGNNNHGSNVGAGFSLNRFGKLDGAMAFGTNQRVDTSFKITSQEFTVSFWLKINALTQGYFLNMWDPGHSGRLIFNDNSGGYFQFFIGTSIASFFPETNRWYHIVGLRDSSDMARLYVDGVEIGSTFRSASLPDTTLQFGGTERIASRHTDSVMEDIRIYDRGLSESEIVSLFVDGKSKYYNSVCLGGSGGVDCLLSYESCPVNYTCLSSLASSEGWDFTNAHVASCDHYDLKLCCSLSLFIDKPVLVYPQDQNDTFIERYPVFNWTDVNDPLSEEPALYDFQLSSNSEFTALEYNETEISSSNFSISSPLGFGDYYWRVRAYNEIKKSDWSDVSTFTLVEYFSFTFLNDTINFEIMNVGESEDTTDNNPHPFVIRNDGNTEITNINITVEDSFWDTAGLGEDNWRIKARSSSSFNTEESQVDWVNVDSLITNLITELKYHEDNEVMIDIALTVPIVEPPGEKTSTLTFWWGVSS